MSAAAPPPVYRLLLDQTGLSYREAAQLHQVRLDTVQSWANGRRRAAAQARDDLAALVARIDEAAAGGLAEIDAQLARRGAPETIELGLAADDGEAQTLGWPTASVQRRVAGRVAAGAIARGLAVIPVWRGASAASAGAADRPE